MRIGYGVKPPIISLDEAVKIIKETYRKGGLINSLDTLATVMDNSVSSSTFNQKVSTLKNFGLISQIDDKYSITGLGQKVVTPNSTQQEADAIADAFKNIQTLFDIWNVFKDKTLPSIKELAKYIGEQTSIPENLTEDWADYFIQSAMFAGLLTDRENCEVLLEPVLTLSSFDELKWAIYQNRPLQNGKKVILAIPDELTESDIEHIRGMLKYIDNSLETLRKHEPPETKRQSS